MHPHPTVRPRARRRRTPSHRLAPVVLAATPLLAHAGVGFNSGSATWSWDADTATANGGKTTFTIAPPSQGSMPTNPNFQLDRSGSFGGATANGKGSIGYVTNATTATYAISAGSGAAQVDPGNTSFPGNTVTRVLFSGLFDATSPGFGPTATGYFSLTVGGFAGANGSTQIAFDLQFRLNSATGALLRSAISGGDTFLGGAGGQSFSKTYTYSAALSPSTISPGNKVYVAGSLSFLANNHGGPSDVVPIALEAGAAPPTATFFGPGGFGHDWFDPATWQQPNNPAASVFSFVELGALVPTIPNGVGQRARFINNSLEPRGAVFTNDVTLGSVHIDSRQPVQFLQDGSATSALTMNVNSGRASIYVGNTAGDGNHLVEVNVLLADDLEVRVEAVRPHAENGGSVLAFDGSIAPVGAPTRNVDIEGGGQVSFNSANTYNGITTITAGGQLNANANGALGAGPAQVFDGGLLVLNTPAPFSSPQLIGVNGAGGVLVNTVAPLAGVTISLESTGHVAGDGPALEQLDAGVGGNLLLAPGSVIGHKSFDVNPATGNPQNLGNTPQYVFGISTDFTDLLTPPIVVGTGASSPWIGFGNDATDRVYGNSPTNAGTAAVTVLGSGDLLATRGRLTLNAPLLGAVSAVANVRGEGQVALNAATSAFAGQIVVTPNATLRVNGALPAVQSVAVLADARLGGDGVIGGPVNVASGGVLDPGDEAGFDDLTGVLTTGALSLASTSLLDFDIGGEGVLNDTVVVTGDLTLDGLLRINQLQRFDTSDVFTLFTFAGNLTDNGLAIDPASQEIFGVPAQDAASIVIQFNPSGPGGVVLLVIPEPGAAVGAGALAVGLISRRRRRA